MISLKNYIMALCILVLFSAASYAQTFNNVPVDANSGAQSETSIAMDPKNSLVLMATWNDFSNPSYSQPEYAFSTDGVRHCYETIR